MSLHAFASWPANQMAISRWNALADEHGFELQRVVLVDLLES